MKKLILLSTAVFLCFQFATAQIKIKQVGVSMGVDEDMIKNLDYTYMLSTGKGIDQSRFANLSFAPETMYGGVCENPNFRAFATLGIPQLKSFDLNVAMLFNFNRYDGVYYYDHTNSSYMSIESMGKEIALETSIQKNTKFLRIFRATAGIGSNIGYGYGGNMSIYGTSVKTMDANMDRSYSEIFNGDTQVEYDNFHETFEVKDALHQRLFVQTGLAVIFLKRLELGLDYRYGKGYKLISGADIKTTTLNSMSLTAKWNL